MNDIRLLYESAIQRIKHKVFKGSIDSRKTDIRWSEFRISSNESNEMTKDYSRLINTHKRVKGDGFRMTADSIMCRTVNKKRKYSSYKTWDTSIISFRISEISTYATERGTVLGTGIFHRSRFRSYYPKNDNIVLLSFRVLSEYYNRRVCVNVWRNLNINRFKWASTHTLDANVATDEGCFRIQSISTQRYKDRVVINNWTARSILKNIGIHRFSNPSHYAFRSDNKDEDGSFRLIKQATITKNDF